jgi:hypothetical protein
MRRARRSKWLDVEPIDDRHVRFVLGLQDVSPGDGGEELIHSLQITGVLSLPDLTIVEIEPEAVYHPYPECGASLEPVRQMAGTRIGPGFRQRVIDLMGRTRGCTHFMALMLDLSAAHTLTTFMRMRQRVPYASRRLPAGDWMRVGLELVPELENACIALRTESPIIRDARKPPTE